MEQLLQLMQETFSDRLKQIILSHSRDRERILKIKIRPVLLKEGLFFQETSYIGTKVFHNNYKAQDMISKVLEYMEGTFQQAEIECSDFKAVVLVSQKGRITIKRQNNKENKETKNENHKNEVMDFSHNRKKNYILPENTLIEFLVDLGVQSRDGKIYKSKYDKFRQINRYLEFVRDILPCFDKDKTIRIIDFGCGKSYLTFALYYYLHQMLSYDLKVVGLDLKEDVIQHCNALSQKYGYHGLIFERGDIAEYENTQDVDMVVSLHACDTATDFALQKAISWNAKVIFAVPCCQHEVNRQIQSELLAPALQYGIIRERMSALLTDAVRANLLESKGYDTDILEFIDMEHTPKNILIRGVKNQKMKKKDSIKKMEEMTRALHIETTLQKQLAVAEIKGD